MAFSPFSEQMFSKNRSGNIQIIQIKTQNKDFNLHKQIYPRRDRKMSLKVMNHLHCEMDPGLRKGLENVLERDFV